jgi:hypothetical protein
VCCPDGVLVRYEATDEEPKVRTTVWDEPLAEIAPKFSEQVLHFPDDPNTYVPNPVGPSISQMLLNERGEEVELARFYPVILAFQDIPR